jgi:DNA-binding response OmpR family regulator
MRPDILVVGNDPRMRELLRLHLSEAGYQVRVAEDAVSAGRKLLARPPELLVLDVAMPYMSGLEFLATLFADAAIPMVPTLFITSSADFAAHAEDLGADFLARPVLKDHLLAVVARNLRARREAPPLGYESAFPVPDAASARA